ncbi:MAG: type II toxin-antitoxin system RelE/ParE family toxin [Deltaproteobacteria bacterium]|nr:type II toxin-antitoxin system RelE/ParE family toxin [Deltaproteobacteria bacterium]
MYEIHKSRTFEKWLTGLKDIRAKAKVLTKLKQVSMGNFGNAKSVGSGISELKIDYGPGYRVYYAKVGNCIVLLLNGGTKSGQNRDIEKAKDILEDWRKQHD